MVSNNSKLIFNYGAMGCGTTRALLKCLYSMSEDGFSPVILKPLCDSKGESNIVSRDRGNAKVDFLISSDDNVYLIIADYLRNNNLDAILVDEAQFFTKCQIDQLSDIVDYFGVDVIST